MRTYIGIARAAASTPWKVKSSGQNHTAEIDDKIEIVSSDGKVIADNEQYYPHAISEADAHFIVHCVNSMPEIIRVLSWIADERGIVRDGDARTDAAKMACALLESIDKVNDVAESGV